jgi:hypothetical protein
MSFGPYWWGCCGRLNARVTEDMERRDPLYPEDRCEWLPLPASPAPLHDGETIVLRNDLLDIQDHLLADDAELLIDCEEDRTLRAVLVGMLREAER